jgi:hypothetical protein
MRAGDELRHSIYYDDNVGNNIDDAHVYGYNDVYVHFYNDVYIHVFDVYGSGTGAHDDVYVHDVAHDDVYVHDVYIHDSDHVHDYDVYVHDAYDDFHVGHYHYGVCAHDDVYVHDYYSASASRSGSQGRYRSA